MTLLLTTRRPIAAENEVGKKYEIIWRDFVARRLPLFIWAALLVALILTALAFTDLRFAAVRPEVPRLRLTFLAGLRLRARLFAVDLLTKIPGHTRKLISELLIPPRDYDAAGHDKVSI